MAEDAKESGKIVPPYVSPATFQNALTSVSEHGVPQVIDKSVLQKFSGSGQRQIMQALRYLGFTNASDQRTEQFVAFEKADADGRKALIRDALLSRYPSQAAILPDGSGQQLQSSFNEFQIEASVRSKCVVFFLQMAKYAGLPISGHISKGSRTSTPRKTTVKPKTKSEDKGKIQEPDSNAPDDKTMTSIQIPVSAVKTWKIQIESQPKPEEVERFIEIIRIVLGVPEKRDTAKAKG